LRDLADVCERFGIAALAPGIVQIVEEILVEMGAGGYFKNRRLKPNIFIYDLRIQRDLDPRK
jgi:hypothetical protein